MKDKINKLSWIVIINIVIGTIFMTILWFTLSNNGQNNKLRSENQGYIVKIKDYKSKITTLSVDQVLDKLKKSNVNVQTSLEKENKNIRKAIDLTYNQTKSEKDYKNLSKELPALVGKEFSDKLIELNKPVVNQSGKKTFQFGQTTDVLITYGKYNYKSIEIPVYVVVNYLSPTIPGSNKKLSGEDLYILTYNLKNKNLKLNRHLEGAISNE